MTSEIAGLTGQLLESRGYKVDLIPATIPKAYSADAFVSLHCDGNASPDPNGAKVARWSQSKIADLDDSLVRNLLSEYLAVTGLRDDTSNVTVNMTGYYGYRIIAQDTPAALIELGFLTNPIDQGILIHDQARAAVGLANGILAFLGDGPPFPLETPPGPALLAGGPSIAKDGRASAPIAATLAVGPSRPPTVISGTDMSGVGTLTGRIVFGANRDKSLYEIYVLNVSDGAVTRLTKESTGGAYKAGNIHPDWSPDGTRIAYMSSRNSVGVDHGWEIWVMNADGSGASSLTPLATQEERDPAWSPNGRLIAFSTPYLDISVMSVDERTRNALTEGGRQVHGGMSDSNPAWSPDGERIAFDSTGGSPMNYDIYTVNVDVVASDRQRLNDNPAQDCEPDWSPDGTKIAFVSDRDSPLEFSKTTGGQIGGGYEVYTMGSDGQNQVRLTRDGGDYSDPTWSPDGQMIAAVSDRDDAIYAFSADGRGMVLLCRGMGPIQGISWGP